MDPKTGRIHHVSSAEEARERGWIPLTRADWEAVQSLSRARRKAWAAAKLQLARSYNAPVGGTLEERRATRNARKRARRDRRST